MSKFEANVVVEKPMKTKFMLRDLPPTTCFRDQYNNVLMRLEDHVYMNVLCGKATRTDGVIWCVYLTCCSGDKGRLIPYAPEQEVIPYITKITVREQDSAQG